MDRERFKRPIVTPARQARPSRPQPVESIKQPQTPAKPPVIPKISLPQPESKSVIPQTTPEPPLQEIDTVHTESTTKADLKKERSIRLKSKRSILVALSILLLIILVGSAVGYKINQDNTKASSTHKTTTKGLINSLQIPNFPVVLSPTSGSNGTFDQYQETYAFFDTLDGTKIQVTEQPQQKKYQSIQQEVDSIAATAGASSSFAVKGGTAHLKTDPSTGVQVVFAPVNDLLITIVSNGQHSIDSWTSYINSLHS